MLLRPNCLLLNYQVAEIIRSVLIGKIRRPIKGRLYFITYEISWEIGRGMGGGGGYCPPPQTHTIPPMQLMCDVISSPVEKDTSSKGRVVQGTHCPRDALSKGRIVQGTRRTREATSKGDIIQWTHCPRDETSQTFPSGTHRSRILYHVIAVDIRNHLSKGDFSFVF